MTIKIGDKFKGFYASNIISVVSVTDEYVIVKYEDNTFGGSKFTQGSENCFKKSTFLGAYEPYTPPREYWTYTFKTQNDKLLNSPLIFESQAKACEHYDRCHKHYVGAPKHKWAHFYKLDNEISDLDKEKEI